MCNFQLFCCLIDIFEPLDKASFIKHDTLKVPKHSVYASVEGSERWAQIRMNVSNSLSWLLSLKRYPSQFFKLFPSQLFKSNIEILEARGSAIYFLVVKTWPMRKIFQRLYEIYPSRNNSDFKKKLTNFGMAKFFSLLHFVVFCFLSQ